MTTIPPPDDSRSAPPAGLPPQRDAIAHHDWAATPLGAADGWDAALRTAVQIMLDTASPTWVAWGPELTYLYNDAQCAILGAKHPAALGLPLQVVWQETWPEVQALIERTLEGRPVTLRDMPLTVDRGDGPQRGYFTFTYSPLRDTGGTIRGLYCSVSDTTAAVTAAAQRAEDERRLRERALDLEGEIHARERERERIWEVSQDMLLVSDMDGVWRSINPAWVRCLGWTETELLGRTSAWIEHPDDQARTRAEVAHLAQGGTTFSFENRLRTRSGDYRHLSWTAALDGRAIYAVARDVTEERARADALRQAEAQLRQAQKMEAVGQLTGGLAHDFNNLLAGIAGSLELIQARVRQGRVQELDRYVGTAQGAVRRAAALTHRLLAFSRQQTLAPTALAADTLVEGLLELLRRTVGPAVAIETAAPPDLWPVLADASQLENALLNLCINARDAMPDGGRIAVRTANHRIDDPADAQRLGLAPGDYVRLCVSDTGTGMPPDVAARAFDPFFTTKPLGQGTGLGLSMIYGFAQQSGGHARIDSQPGRGTRVCLYLPRHRGTAAALPGDDRPAPDAAGRGPGAGDATVLVVDDESTVRLAIVDALRDRGWRCLEAADAAGGLALLRADTRIDLLVTDIGLPGGMSGRQMAGIARGLRPALPVLFVTGFAENALADDGALEPGMAVLTKPFVLDTLAAQADALVRSGG